MNVLITGGAGYIGAITNKLLRDHGHNTVIFDNLTTGHTSAIGDTELIIGDLTHSNEIQQAFKERSFDAVIHFAALALAGESMQKPYEYYHVNVLGGLNLLEAMRVADCKRIVFSSTCAVFGYPDTLPVTESSVKNPISVYGESKLMVENILARYDELYSIKSAVLRYFNAAGALSDGSMGEDHTPETHIIPNAMRAIIEQNKTFELFGTDYNTRDGSCIRDYIHVTDLADAHLKALEHLKQSNESFDCNLGSGKGITNRELLTTIENVSGQQFTIVEKPRRSGDPDEIYSNFEKAERILGWKPVHSSLEEIITSAWKWHSRNQQN